MLFGERMLQVQLTKNMKNNEKKEIKYNRVFRAQISVSPGGRGRQACAGTIPSYSKPQLKICNGVSSRSDFSDSVCDLGGDLPLSVYPPSDCCSLQIVTVSPSFLLGGGLRCLETPFPQVFHMLKTFFHCLISRYFNINCPFNMKHSLWALFFAGSLKSRGKGTCSP